MAGGFVDVEVAGFKSIRRARLQLAPLTVILGPPATGKSNLLEALEVFGYAVKVSVEVGLGEYRDAGEVGALEEYVRVVRCRDLVTAGSLEERFRVRVGGVDLEGYCTGPARLALSLRGRVIEAEVKAELRGRVRLGEVLTDTFALPAARALGEKAEALVRFMSALSWLFVEERGPAAGVRLAAGPGGEGREALYAPRLYSFDRLGVLPVIQYNMVDRDRPLSYLDERALNLGWLLYHDDEVYGSVEEALGDFVEGIRVQPLGSGRLAFLDGGRDVGPASVSDTVLRVVYGAAALASNRVLEGDVEAVGADGGEHVVVGVRVEPVVMVEEPEAHMHPWAYGGFVDGVVRRVSEGLRVLVSTHSGRLADLLYERTRRVGRGAVEVYYAVRRPGEPTRLYRVDVDTLYAERAMTLDELVSQDYEVVNELVADGVLEAAWGREG